VPRIRFTGKRDFERNPIFFSLLALPFNECQIFFTALLKAKNRIPTSSAVRAGNRGAGCFGRFNIGGLHMTFRPLHDRVLVRRIEAEEKTAGGIIIPDTAKEKPQEGEIVAAGPGARDESGKLIAPDVKAGDRVLFGKWSGTEVKINGEELLIMKESDILGVIEIRAETKKAA
jgi:chaperonin GroES